MFAIRIGSGFARWAALLGLAQSVWAMEPIERLLDFWTLDPAVRAEGVPYELEVEVVYYDAEWKVLYLQDASGATFLTTNERLPFKSGQRVALRGTTAPTTDGYVIDGAAVQVLGPAETVFQRIDFQSDDHRTVSFPVEGYGLVESQELVDANHLRLDLVVDGVTATVWVWLDAQEPVPAYEGMLVRVRGVDAPQLDGTGAVVGNFVFCPGTAQVLPEGPLPAWAGFQDEAVSIGRLAEHAGEERVKVEGRVVEVLPGALRVQDEAGEVTVHTGQRGEVWLGQRVEAAGHPRVDGVELYLERAWVDWADDALAGRDPQLQDGQVRRLHRIAATVLAMAPRQASRSHPVALDGVVTWSDPREMLFYLQDSSGGVGIYRPSASVPPPPPGTRLVVEGVTVMGAFAPRVQASRLVTEGTLPLPRPRRVDAEEALTGAEDAQWVEVVGTVTEVRRGQPWSLVQFSARGGSVAARLADGDRLDELAGAVVSVRGICVAVADEQRRLEGVEIWGADTAALQVLDPGGDAVFAAPELTLGEVGRFQGVSDRRRRVRVGGTVLHWSRAGRLYLTAEGETLQVLTQSERPAGVMAGRRVEAAGLPGHLAGRVVLRDAVVRLGEAGSLPVPERLKALGELQPELDGRWVSLTARLGHVYAVAGQWRFSLWQDEVVFPAEWSEEIPEVAAWPLGSTIALEGVYALDRDERGTPVGFRILVDDPTRVKVVALPSAWTRERWRTLAGVALLGGLVFAGLWWWQRRRSVVE